MERLSVKICILAIVVFFSVFSTEVLAELNETGGPDAFGYTYFEKELANVTPDSGPDSWMDIQTFGRDAGTLRKNMVLYNIPIGFNFKFYGKTYSEVNISTNGFLFFGNSALSGCCSGDPIPTPGGKADNLIAALWDDLQPDGCNIHLYYKTVGNAPNRKFVVFFVKFGFMDQQTSNSFEVVLYENSNDIRIYYLQANFRGSENTSAGLENSDGTIGLKYKRADTVSTEFYYYVHYSAIPTVVNQPPVANSGADQSVTPGQTVTLDGSRSRDPDGRIASYQWNQIGDGVWDWEYTNVDLSSDRVAKPTFTAPDVDEILMFDLTVTDDKGEKSSDRVNVSVVRGGNVPTADAGPDQSVYEGDLVTLDGSSTPDPLNDIVGYQWTQTSGTHVNISGANSLRATFTAPTIIGINQETLSFSLEVENSDGMKDSDIVNIAVLKSGVNPPEAEAGNDLFASPGDTVILDGSGSTDLDNDITSFRWEQISGSTMTLSNASSSQASFNLPIDFSGTEMSFRLTVEDSEGLTDSDTVVVRVGGEGGQPIAHAGIDQTVNMGQVVMLNGTATQDPDGYSDIDIVFWEQTSGPAVELRDANRLRPQFTAPHVDQDGETLEFILTVTDKTGLSDSDEVEVFVRQGNMAPVADAGPDLHTLIGQVVTLDGSMSSDADSGVRSYEWEQKILDPMFDTSVDLSSTTGEKVTFTAPTLYGMTPYLRFVLTVTDMEGATSTDEVAVYITETAKLFFPNIKSGGQWESELGLINTSSDSTVTGELKAYDTAGNAVDTLQISIPPHGRRQVDVGEAWQNSEAIDYAVFEGTSLSINGYLKIFTAGKYRVAMPAVFLPSSGDIFIPHIASDENWTTEITLLNTTNEGKTAFVSFDSGDNISIELGPKQQRTISVRDMFQGQQKPNLNAATIRNSEGLIGMALYEWGNLLGGILIDDRLSDRIAYPHIANDGEWGTGVVIYNPSTIPRQITISPYTVSGEELPTSIFTLEGKSKYIGVVSDLALPENTAWFEASSDGGITGFELFFTWDFNQYAGYNLIDVGGNGGVFPKIERGGGATGIAFVNTDTDNSTIVTLTAYSDGGNMIAREVFDLMPGEKVVNVVQDFFGEDISSASYVNYTADNEIIGFQLNRSSDQMMLDALAAGR